MTFIFRLSAVLTILLTVACASASAAGSALINQYHAHLQPLAAFSLSPIPIQIIITRHDRESIAVADQEAFRIAKMLHLHSLSPSAHPMNNHDASISEFKIFGGLSSINLLEGKARVVVNEQFIRLLAPDNQDELFRRYQLLHEVFGHGNLIQYDKATELLRTVLEPLLPATVLDHPEVVPAYAAASVFHESYADVLPILLTFATDGIDEGEKMLKMVFSFRANTNAPPSNDSHDTRYALKAVQRWIASAAADQWKETLSSSSNDQRALVLHNQALSIAVAGSTKWMISDLGLNYAEATEATHALSSFYETRLLQPTTTPLVFSIELQPELRPSL